MKPRVRASAMLAATILAVGAAPPPVVPPPREPLVHVLDAAVFARGADALGDIKPVTRTVALFSKRVSDAVLDVGDAVPDFSQRPVRSAIELRRSSTNRIPLVDSLIAGSAFAHKMVLVHRDGHMEKIEDAPQKVIALPNKAP